MSKRSNSSVYTGVNFAGQLPRAVENHVENVGINQEMTLPVRSKVRSKYRLLFCY